MVRNAAVLLACLLMFSGGLSMLAGAPPSAAAPVVPAAGSDGPAGMMDCDGPRDLVPPAPWNTASDPGPFQSLNRSRHPAKSPLAVTGEAKVLVMLVSFNDTSNSSTHTPAYFNDFLFNASSSSMNKFFRDNSYNTFNVTGNVTTKFYQMNHTMAYYGRYETSSPPVSGYGNSQNLTYDVLMAADADINYSEYDQDNDGYVDHLLVIHAGGDEASTGVANDIWSHAWGLNSLAVKLDGKWLNAYTMLSEHDPIGVFVHEFGHDLGLPDLYDTDYSSDGGCGRWEVMASGSWNNGGASPSMLGAWCRKELGWITPTTVNSDTAGLAAKRVFDNATVFRVIVNNSNNEYFLIENRQQTGWDTYLPGNGLLIWHINETATGNTRDNYRLVDLEEWDNNNNAANANDAWKNNATGFTPTSSPNTNDYSGKRTDIRIYNISASGATMYFDVDLGNNPPSVPTATAPADGAWLGVSRPTVNWTFSDSDAGDTQAAYRVQVDGDSTFASVDWDSGEVAASSAFCTVGSALAEGKWYWRVCTRDGGGLWSNYSIGRSFSIDLTPPAAPTALTASPSGWTAANSFSIDWTIPSESGTSGILTGAYYKLDTAPANATDGTWSSSKPITGITVGSAGNHTIYVWLKDNVGNVNQSNRRTTYLYYDNVAPKNPNSLTSPTHVASAWSNLSAIKVQWSGASDDESGLDGYSFLWDTNANTVPDTVRDCTALVLDNTTPALADGTYYFHIRTVDKVGNWASTAVHLGPFFIDLTAPGGVLVVTSGTHTTGRWSPLNAVSVQWTGAADFGSGIGLYAYAWDRTPGTIPDATATVGAGVSTLVSPALTDASGWYFHIRVRDAVGNWNATAFHLGPFDIDTTPPSNPDSFTVLSRHTVNVWSPERLVKAAWSGHADALSGVSGFSVSWDRDPAGTADATMDVIGAGYTESNQDGVCYLHIRAVDAAGNWAAGAYTAGPFKIDLEAPSAPLAVAEKALTNSRSLRWSWSPATDAGSGVAHYVVWIVNDPARPGEGRQDASPSASYTLRNALDGMTYHIQVRAVDAVGNAGQYGAFSTGTLVDLSPPRDVRVVINGGAGLTGSPNVGLSLSASDRVSGVADMRFGQDGSGWTAWAPFSEAQDLVLEPGDGLKTVQVQLRDRAGNEALAVRASIVLDTAGPAITVFRQAGGSPVTAGRRVALEVSASDAHSRVDSVRLGSDGASWEPWQAFGAVLSWELSAGDGPKEIQVQARDRAGNIGPARKLTLLLDTTPPGAPVVTSSTHPKSDVWYNLPGLAFSWQAPADASGIAGYAWILTPDGRDEPGLSVQLAATTLNLPVPGEGRWLFKVRAIDQAGNCGSASTFSLRIDLAGPAPPRTDLPADNWEFLPADQLSLSWSGAQDALSGVKGYFVQVDDDADYSSPAWEGVVDQTSYVLPPLPEGSYRWHVKARDLAGNFGEYGTGSAFTVRTPEKPIPETQKEPFMSLANPLFLLTIVVLIAVVGGIAAAAARRRKKEPPAEAPPADPGAPVNWE
jgi:immune inhibitor A